MTKKKGTKKSSSKEKTVPLKTVAQIIYALKQTPKVPPKPFQPGFNPNYKPSFTRVSFDEPMSPVTPYTATPHGRRDPFEGESMAEVERDEDRAQFIKDIQGRDQKIAQLSANYNILEGKLREEVAKHKAAKEKQEELMMAEEAKIAKIKAEWNEKLNIQANQNQEEINRSQREIFALKNALHQKEQELHNTREAAAAGKGEIAKEALAALKKGEQEWAGLKNQLEGRLDNAKKQCEEQTAKLKEDYGKLLKILTDERNTADAYRDQAIKEANDWKMKWSQLHNAKEEIRIAYHNEIEKMKVQYENKVREVNSLNETHERVLSQEQKKCNEKTKDAEAREKVLKEEKETLKKAYTEMYNTATKLNQESNERDVQIGKLKGDIMGLHSQLSHLAEIKQKELDHHIAQANKRLDFLKGRFAELEKERDEANQAAFHYKNIAVAQTIELEAIPKIQHGQQSILPYSPQSITGNSTQANGLIMSYLKRVPGDVEYVRNLGSVKYINFVKLLAAENELALKGMPLLTGPEWGMLLKFNESNRPAILSEYSKLSLGDRKGFWNNLISRINQQIVEHPMGIHKPSTWKAPDFFNNFDVDGLLDRVEKAIKNPLDPNSSGITPQEAQEFKRIIEKTYQTGEMNQKDADHMTERLRMVGKGLKGAPFKGIRLKPFKQRGFGVRLISFAHDE